MKFRSIASRLIGYLWTAPNTLLGSMAGVIVVCLGGHARLVCGVAEFHGGLLGRLLVAASTECRFSAITLGHVILGINGVALDAVRRHEHVHVRQYECWGPFFLPAYGISSLWQLLRGRRVYQDNYFERKAYGALSELGR